MKFNEQILEQAIIELFTDEGYTSCKGKDLSREKSEVLLIEDLHQYLVNRYSITYNEVQTIIRMLKNITGTIYEANKAVFKMLSNGFIFNREDRTQKDIFIEFMDFENSHNNNFKIVNQIEIDGYSLRIPDGIVYINGIPVVVLEFKSTIRENTPIYEAYEKLTIRYKRDIPELFKYNAFVVIRDGVNTKYGSMFALYDFFYTWRKIDDLDKEVDGINSLITMIKGLFSKERLLDVIKNYIYFPDNSTSEEKIVCRYPQYFATKKLFANIKQQIKPYGDGKGGTYFGTTGCGKSYTMVFLSRLLMKSQYFGSPTIVIITDRTDLDDQLSNLFINSKEYIGDNTIINMQSREKLKANLQGRESGGVYLTTIHKFTEDISLLTDRNNVICISDEAHRSQINLNKKVTITEKGVKQKYGFAKYLHDSLPNATYVGFTDTPIDATIKVFGSVVDAYTMTESVKDGITVNLVYEGRSAKVNLDTYKVEEIEAYYEQCEKAGANEYQLEASKKAVINLNIILGSPDRLQLIVQDFVNHYERRVYEGATVLGKAMFVCADRVIAYEFYKLLIQMYPEWAELKECDEGLVLSDDEKKEIKPMAKVNLVMTRDKKRDSKELYDMLGSKDYRKELDRQYKKVKSNFKIAIVVDMWLTGFDVPSLDTIYIDKPINSHNLIQTISRVNRVYEGKDKGLIVDYIGIKDNLNNALATYTNYKEDQFEEVEHSVIIVKDELEVLANIFYKFNNNKYFNGTPKEQLDCLNKAVEYVQLSEELERRFMQAVTRLKKAFNLCSGSELLTEDEMDYSNFYFAVKSILFKLTKGETPDVSQMNKKVIEMIEAAIKSEGIEELFNISSDMESLPIDIFSDEYINKIASITLPNTKIKVLQSLLSKAIDKFKKVNKVKGIEFSNKLQSIINKYNNRRKDEGYAAEVLQDIAEQLADLLAQLREEENSGTDKGIDIEEKAFYDILALIAKKYEFEYAEDRLIALAKQIKKIVDDKAKYIDWTTRDDIKAELEVDLIILLDEYEYPPVTIDDVFKEVLEQAENFKKYKD
ncbi:MAG: type I restriction endonuclease [Epulopiscium sp. Nuni2H_MBin001]|nr:MAG: type I restriction endonuclease [Epulopiscium sp. Nuni2H_MBin001]